ncbi:MAG: CotH kinase family protein [Flavobacteriales bacterium]|nr:CotH kinase family protein [Flavobacteriales bacterium]
MKTPTNHNPVVLLWLITVLAVGCTKKEHQELKTLRINIPESTLDVIDKYVDIAIDQEVISSNLKRYFDAELVRGDSTVPIKIRLKGDWTDHVNTSKISFRIKMPKKSHFFDYSIFSIQNPETKSFLDEWFLRKIFKREGILTPRYEFINVIINNEIKGIYALEEHFQAELLASNNKATGPILKIAEDGFWEANVYERENDVKIQKYYPIYEASIIRPFNVKSVLKSPVLYEQFIEAQSVLFALKNGKVPVDELIKLDELAKLYAICDMARVNHGFAAHNQRWYYDSTKKLLGPIAHDFNGIYRQPDEVEVIYGFRRNEIITMWDSKHIIPFSPFNNKKFNDLYFQYLSTYCSEKYLNTIFDYLDNELTLLENLIQQEHFFYSFDKSHYYDNISRIKTQLQLFENPTSREGPLYQFKPMNIVKNEQNVHLFTSVSVNAYFDSRDSTLFLQNFHSYSINITGFYSKSKEKIDMSSVTLSAYNQPNASKTIRIIQKPSYILFCVSDKQSEVFKTKIIPWPHPEKYYSKAAIPVTSNPVISK